MPRKPRMLFIPLDVEFFDNARVLAVGEGPAWLYLSMACRAKRLATDGVLTELQVERLTVKDWRKRLVKLLDAGLVARTDDGDYLIVGWLERNLSNDEITNYRRKDSERKRTHGRPGIRAESDRNPSGIRTDSGAEEEDREKKKSEVVPAHLTRARRGAA